MPSIPTVHTSKTLFLLHFGLFFYMKILTFKSNLYYYGDHTEVVFVHVTKKSQQRLNLPLKQSLKYQQSAEIFRDTCQWF